MRAPRIRSGTPPTITDSSGGSTCCHPSGLLAVPGVLLRIAGGSPGSLPGLVLWVVSAVCPIHLGGLPHVSHEQSVGAYSKGPEAWESRQESIRLGGFLLTLSHSEYPLFVGIMQTVDPKMEVLAMDKQFLCFLFCSKCTY